MPTTKNRASYMKAYRANQKDPDGSDRKLLRETWKLGLARLKTPIYVKFDGTDFRSEFPGAVPHAMAVLSGGRHLKALFDQGRTLKGWMYELLVIAFLGNSLERLIAKKLVPDRLARWGGEHTVEEARELAKLMGKQGTDKRRDEYQSVLCPKSKLDSYFAKEKLTNEKWVDWQSLQHEQKPYGTRRPTEIYDKEDEEDDFA